MEYDVICSDSLDEFKEKVNDAIRNGWVLIDGFCVDAVPVEHPDYTEYETWYYQPMTKRNTEDAPPFYSEWTLPPDAESD